MKKIKSLLRYWIAGVSIAGFLFGWITFAHSSKPAALAIFQGQATASVSTGQTSASTAGGSNTQASIQSFQVIQPPQFSTSPRLRTGGS